MTETQRKSGWLNRSRRIVKYYYLKVMRNSGSPEYIARGAALGIFIGFAIPIGFQIAAAVPGLPIQENFAPDRYERAVRVIFLKVTEENNNE